VCRMSQKSFEDIQDLVVAEYISFSLTNEARRHTTLMH